MYNKPMGLAGTVGVVILGLSACADSPDSDFTTMCQTADYIRIEDYQCDVSNPEYVSGSSIVYISTGSSYNAPPHYGKIDQSKIMTSIPPGKTVQRATIPGSGGIVKNSPGISRGGFGNLGGGNSGS